MYYQEWLSLGERLGLAGQDLAIFIEKKETEFIERDERVRRREDERRVAEMQFQLQLKERELELEKLRVDRVEERPIQSMSLRPKLPKYDEKSDDMDAYIERFERYARSQAWSEDSWAVSLSSLLTGKGLEVYTSMSPEEASNYKALKIEVLKRYQLTEEGFRMKFRTSKPESGETVLQYIAKLRRYFVRWIEMAKVEDTYEALCDLMVREQFIKSCSTDLALFLKERAPRSIEEVTRIAEQYSEAHGGKISPNKPLWSPHPRKNMTEARPVPQSKEAADRKRPKTCFICDKPGHYAKDCRRKFASGPAIRPYTGRKVSAVCANAEIRGGPIQECTENGQLKLANGDSLPVFSGGCTIEMLGGDRNLDIQMGFVGSTEVKVLRDTGCELAAVRKELVKDEQFLEKQIVMITIDGQAKVVPTAKIFVNTPYFTGELEAMVPKSLICDLILGNIPGVLDKPDQRWTERHAPKTMAAVMTRSQQAKAEQPLKLLNVPVPSCDKEITVDSLKKAQKEDTSFDKLWSFAKGEQMKETKSGASYKYTVRTGVLYRVFLRDKRLNDQDTLQIVVPTPFRKRVMELAHESIMGGHLSSKKTEDRIITSFYWPGVSSDVGRFCRSCDVCQRTIPKGRVKRVPLGIMPIIEEPFYRVAVDIIGPIVPVSDNGNRYILTMVDYATRYPEAVALPKIDTERIAEAMLSIFARVGFPSEILSDRGSQFTSDLMKEVSRLISVKQLFTAPYNPRCNGLCERINGVMKDMLKKMCQERPKDWDRYLPAVLFAYREVPQSSTGFSPFELLYGRTVRGPLQILQELWTEEKAPETHNTYQYVLDLKQRLEETCKIAKESLKNAQRTFKHHYDKRTRRRFLNIGDKALVLLPTDKNKMLLQWKGPFEVVGKLNQMDYKVKVGDRIATYHINLLKKYEERLGTIASSACIIEAEDESQHGAVDDENLLELPKTTSSETYRNVKVSANLLVEQKQQVEKLLYEFRAIFTDLPGTTSLTEHKVELTDGSPIRVKQYPIPYAKRTDVDSEIQAMLEMDVIEPAVSDYNSPIVMVKKKDGSNRFCVDFRKLNSITKFDTEPTANIIDILAKLKDKIYFTKIDLAKGYWQVPVATDCRHLTAFSTYRGSYQFKKMPFGMVNSGATFNRMMRKMLNHCNNVDNYVDDILGHTVTWDQHIDMLRTVFTKISEANLTVRPSKCMIGFQNIGFTGHMVGNGVIQMEDEKIERIKQAAIPSTKRQVRAFLGLAGYYRRFIPMFAEIASPLTDLTKKGQPNTIRWSPVHDRAFRLLKEQLTRAPILRLPDFSKEFILQSDASDTGIGAALLQKYDDGMFPIAFASKKLLQRERNYSVTERDCLAIIFGIKKFQTYLYGKEFIIQTDHSALSYIQTNKIENGRIMRWALFLQTYRFRIDAIKGSDNILADYLSRQDQEENSQLKAQCAPDQKSNQPRLEAA